MAIFRHSALLLLHVIKHRQRQPIKLETLALMVGLCRNQLMHLIAALEKDGLLSVDRSEHINAYELTSEGFMYLSAAAKMKGALHGRLPRFAAMD